MINYKMSINNNLCLSIKSKNNFIQCTRLKKQGEDYCGIHLRSKKVIRYDEYLKSLCPSDENLDEIIKIQKHFRGWNIRRRNKSNNKEDFATMESIYEIPIKYYFDYLDDDGFTYAFDTRTLNILLEEENPKNPYNLKDFPFKEIKNKEKYEKPNLTKEEEYQDYLIKVFQKIDKLGNYTNIEWFNELTFEKLKCFYRDANDMFDYRAQLSQETKLKLVSDGLLFHKLINNLKYYKNKHFHFLRMETLKEIERICDEGKDNESKILGCNLLMTVLTEHSYQASIAMPHLVQANFGY